MSQLNAGSVKKFIMVIVRFLALHSFDYQMNQCLFHCKNRNHKLEISAIKYNHYSIRKFLAKNIFKIKKPD
ncbi:hypothetical protein BOQ62_14475 [Chryseobacterium sp. CH21]|nr:hypothetical protein BOQ62_14475 [Chryseobacterium sp. CH21]